MEENVTDYQFETLLKMILEIVKGCKENLGINQ